MTSLTEKQIIEDEKTPKRWPQIAAAVSVLLIIAIIVLSVLLPTGKNRKPLETVGSSVPSDASSSLSGGQSSTDPTGSVNSSTPDDSSAEGSSVSEVSSTDGSKTDSSNTVSDAPSTGSGPDDTTPSSPSGSSSSSGTQSVTSSTTSQTPSRVSSSSGASSSANVSSTDSSKVISSDASSTSSGGSTDATVTYTYTAATAVNAVPTGYSVLYDYTDCVVVTGVSGVSADGVYTVPDTLGGKKVVAVMPSAFSGAASSVKKVYLPSSVRVIWGDAFTNCNALTDIYLKSSAIYIYNDAFVPKAQRSGTLTIHCKRECRDFDYYYYRNVAARYGAEYEEWNG
ncbi:MAG: leucine-rich repeat protein [Clostridia bacterium]|nr:leucine-rich repeat protein [Clostridia bacterium]